MKKESQLPRHYKLDLKGHVGAIHSVLYSRDGAYCLTVIDDFTCILI